MTTAHTAAEALASLLDAAPWWLPPVNHWEVAEDVNAWTISGQLAGEMPEARAFRLLAPMLEIAESPHSDDGRLVKVPFVWEGVTGQVWYLRPTSQWPVTDTASAVRELGALPVPVGTPADGITRRIAPTQVLAADKPATACRCHEPDADPYSCEAEDCTYEFFELSPFASAAKEHDAKVSKTCGCGWTTSVWHVDDGSAEEELHRHVARAHGGTYPSKAGA